MGNIPLKFHSSCRLSPSQKVLLGFKVALAARSSMFSKCIPYSQLHLIHLEAYLISRYCPAFVHRNVGALQELCVEGRANSKDYDVSWYLATI